MIGFKRWPRRKKKRFIVFYIFLFILIGIIITFSINITNVLISISEATIRSITTVAVNDAIYYTLSDVERYEDLMEISYDDNGDIKSISSNPLKINRIARDTAYLSQQNLTKYSEEGIKVPLGAFTGIEVLAGFGPKIDIKIIPISNVECKFSSSFEAMGINQTKHSIYLEIIADISIIMPTETTNLASMTEVLICESVLVGKIPDTYFNSDFFGQKYSLSP